MFGFRIITDRENAINHFLVHNGIKSLASYDAGDKIYFLTEYELVVISIDIKNKISYVCFAEYVNIKKQSGLKDSNNNFIKLEICDRPFTLNFLPFDVDGKRKFFRLLKDYRQK